MIKLKPLYEIKIRRSLTLKSETLELLKEKELFDKLWPKYVKYFDDDRGESEFTELNNDLEFIEGMIKNNGIQNNTTTSEIILKFIEDDWYYDQNNKEEVLKNLLKYFK